MSQNVTQFVKEAEVIWRGLKDNDKVKLVKNAQANVTELFSHTKLQAASRPEHGPFSSVLGRASSWPRSAPDGRAPRRGQDGR